MFLFAISQARKTCTPLVTLKISLTNFHLRIGKFMNEKTPVKIVFTALI